MKLDTTRRSGFTLVEIMIVLAIIGLLAATAIPNFVRARNTAQTKTCINNLRQVDGAKQQWALENRKSDTDTPVQTDVEVYIKNSRYPACPTGGSYTIGSVNTDPKCTKASEGHFLLEP